MNALTLFDPHIFVLVVSFGAFLYSVAALLAGLPARRKPMKGNDE